MSLRLGGFKSNLIDLLRGEVAGTEKWLWTITSTLTLRILAVYNTWTRDNNIKSFY